MDRTLRLYGFINKIYREKPLFSPHDRPPHTHSWDSSPFTEAQLTQPSPFDHRTHPLYGRTALYVSMALLTKFIGKNHSFHHITAPRHILGTPPLSLRHDHRTHTLYGRTGLYVSMALLTKFLGKKHSFHHITNPHTHFLDSSPFTEAQVIQPSPFDHRTHPLYGRTGLYVSMALLTKFLGKNHSFHRITAPTHIIGTPPLSLRHK